MKALRLPTRVSTVTYWFAPAAHAILLASCTAVALLKERRSPPGRGLCCCRQPCSGFSHVDANGISQRFPLALNRRVGKGAGACVGDVPTRAHVAQERAFAHPTR